jgi:hypothetical protein
MVLGVAGLLLVGPGDAVEPGLADPQPGAVVGLGGEGELGQHRVARRRRLALGGAPAEGEPVGRLDGVDHHGGADGLRRGLVLEHQRPGGPGPDVEIDPVGEPQGDLVGLGDGPPHDVDGRLDDDLAGDGEVGHDPPLLRSIGVQPTIAHEAGRRNRKLQS